MKEVPYVVVGVGVGCLGGLVIEGGDEATAAGFGLLAEFGSKNTFSRSGKER